MATTSTEGAQIVKDAGQPSVVGEGRDGANTLGDAREDSLSPWRMALRRTMRPMRPVMVHTRVDGGRERVGERLEGRGG